METGMMYTINGDTFFCSWRTHASCHIMNNNNSLFDVININDLIQGSSRNMLAVKKGKLCINVWQVDGTEWVHIQWHMKFCANLYILTCKHLQGKKISSDHQNNIVVKTMDGDIILDCQIKTHDNWVAGVKFLHVISDEKGQSAAAHCKKNIKGLHIDLCHPSKSITLATAKAMGIQVTGTLKSCDECTLGKAKQQGVSKRLLFGQKCWEKRFSLI